MSSNDHDDTCATMFTNLCVSVTSLHIDKITQTHKDKPSTLQELGHKHDIKINMPKTIVGQTSKKEVRHIEETLEMTLCL